MSDSSAEQGRRRIEQLHTRWHGKGNGRLQVGLAAWAPDMCSPELLRDLRTLQERLDIVATIHLNQLWGEVAAVQEQAMNAGLECHPTEKGFHPA